MNDVEISNLLLTFVAIAWYAKIWFHFKYLKLVKENLKSSSLLSFFTNTENIFDIVGVIMPIFLGNKQSDLDVVKGKMKVRIFTCLLWLTFAVSFFHLYTLPEENEIKKVEYDLTGRPN